MEALKLVQPTNQTPEVKVCRECHKDSSEVVFELHRNTICKSCRAKYNTAKAKEFKLANPELVKRRKLACYRKHREEYKNNPRNKEIHHNYRVKNPELVMWQSARSRAKRLGRNFSIEVTDIFIPTHCECGRKIEPSIGQPSYGSPSLDCIIASLDYIKGNTRVICQRCNTIKGDATLEELEQVCASLRNVMRKL
jgi:hypothetical protein